MTLEEFRKTIPWSRAELARQAGLDNATVRNAEAGSPIQAKSADAIIQALSRAKGRQVELSEISTIVIR